VSASAAVAPIRERTEQVCLALARAELEVAFSYLRLAEAESHGGNVAHAQDLVSKSQMTYLTAVRYIDSLTPDSDVDWCELQSDFHELFGAIRRMASLLALAS